MSVWVVALARPCQGNVHVPNRRGGAKKSLQSGATGQSYAPRVHITHAGTPGGAEPSAAAKQTTEQSKRGGGIPAQQGATGEKTTASPPQK